MNKSLFTLILTLSLTAVVIAQDGYKKGEVFVGYSFGQVDVDFDANRTTHLYENRAGHDGFNASGVFNVSRYFGIKGDVSGTYNNSRFSFQVPVGVLSNPIQTVAFDSKNSLYNILGGVQIKDNASKGRFKPFAHVLVGAGIRRNRIEPMTCIAIIPCPTSNNETALAGAFGGGLDVRVNDRFSVRVIQADYNPIKYDSGVSHNKRFSFGVVF
jgi:hypothetical protein